MLSISIGLIVLLTQTGLGGRLIAMSFSWTALIGVTLTILQVTLSRARKSHLSLFVVSSAGVYVFLAILCFNLSAARLRINKQYALKSLGVFNAIYCLLKAVILMSNNYGFSYNMYYSILIYVAETLYSMVVPLILLDALHQDSLFWQGKTNDIFIKRSTTDQLNPIASSITRRYLSYEAGFQCNQ
jgi:hypothetical protein